MKIVQINTFPNGSTGTIMMNIHKELEKQGYESYVVWGRGRKSKNEHEIYLDDKIGVYFHALYARITGKVGFASKRATRKLLKKLDTIKPDIIHLHNIHGYYINIEMLFKYIKKNNIKVIWTLHDCWSFTGQCPYFTSANCDKWKQECYKCPKIKEYPKAFIDNSRKNYKKKKELFTNLNMKLVTPSKWLANLVKESYLKEYEVEVINNGIDTNIFKPIETDFRKRYNIEDKKIILGVANVWDARKGLNDFIELSKILDDNYVIVLIGLSKKQIKRMPENVIGITRTENQQELAGIYSTADILFNPTYEDNYPTVNLEALACGTPVLTYDTGGSGEIVEKFCSMGRVIKKEKYYYSINNVLNTKSYIMKNNVYIKRDNSYVNNISLKNMIDCYINYYKEERGRI